MSLHLYVLSYREWAAPVVEAIKRHPNVGNVETFDNTEEYVMALEDALLQRVGRKRPKPDLILYVGWSDEPVKKLVKQVLHVGVHCAESDVYSGGTPLQNQIIDGIRSTKHRIFKVGHPELSERLWSHQVELGLWGNMSNVLQQMTSTSITLFNAFLDEWPDVEWKTWPAVDPKQMRFRRTKDQSILTKDHVAEMTTMELYNFFRCLEAPYPNGCIEDEYGTLYIEKVRFKSK